MVISSAPGIYRGRQIVAFVRRYKTTVKPVLTGANTKLNDWTGFGTDSFPGALVLNNDHIDASAYEGLITRIAVWGFWDSNATGYRTLTIENGANIVLAGDTKNPISGTVTHQTACFEGPITAADNLFNAEVFQNSGLTLNFNGASTNPMWMSMIVFRQ